jgi:ubiquinone/menaquinone biosynthesis C-methylase UbiE
MDRLPFTSAQFDVVIFNASFHYSEDYQRTLRESLRCLRRPGYVLIVDSPFYPRDESGRRMMEERHAEFQRKYGFRSDSISSCEYITQSVLDDLARDNQVIWKTLKPWYGLGWALRPAWRWLCGRREPAKFHIFWGIVGAR